jgi:1-aminocyclopropane-1-carboxylate deaminase/D-cysteine desulfhydrase-like pyridoxal-dependent ACC family enzyme
MSATEALSRLAGWPRQRLAHLPTPLIAVPGLVQALAQDTEGGVPELLVKMDADTGFALGGNKVRKLEFELEPLQLEGVTHLITAGGPQSHHCRVTSASAARLGLGFTLVLNGPEPSEPRGNALLHRLFGATIRTVTSRDARDAAMLEVAEEIRRQGGHPLVVPLGASTGRGALAYAAATVEMAAQLDRLEPRDRTWIFVSASSCGTLAGILLGVSLLGRTDIRLVGVSADVSAFDLRTETMRLAQEGADLLGWTGPIREGAVAAADEFVGEGYGIPTRLGDEATDLFARLSGLVLDPVYTAKAASGMIQWVRRGSVPPDHRVVFVHTGGHPALLA